MAQVRDVVCGMMVDTDSAPARASYQGKTYYFCTPECRDQFESNPSRYTSRSEPANSRVPGHDEDVEKHEPPYTKSGHMVAPKFGAAGSGGAEYEPIPEQHKEK